jgi:Glycosyltransferase
MKIILLSPAHPYRGGIAASGEKLAQTLQAQGHEVDICTFKMQYPGFLFPGKSQYSSAPAPSDLKIYRGMHSVFPWNWLAQGRKIRKKHYDLVLVRYWTPFMAPALASICRVIGKKGARRVALIDNFIPHERHFWDKMLNRYFLNAVDACVVMSQQVAEEIKSMDTQKPVGYAPHPVYDIYGESLPRAEAAARLGLDPAQSWVLFFGLIRAYKGLDWLLDAWAFWRAKGGCEGKKLLVAGEFYEDEAKYREQIARLGLESEVVIHNHFIPDAEVSAYFSLADVVVQPYKTATQSGITQIAYHFERPMIVTHVGGLPEIVLDGKTGYVTACEPLAIAQALEKFYAEPTDRFEAALHEEKQRFSWEALANVCTQTLC